MNSFMEECLILLKPDCIEKSCIGEIISRIERTGLTIAKMRMVHVSPDLISEHYPDDPSWLKTVGLKKIQKFQAKGRVLKEDSLSIGKKVRASLIHYFSGKQVIVIVVKGTNAIACMRKIAGNTEPFTAEPGTIRGDYSTDSYEVADSLDRPIQNAIHVSDSPESSQREMEIWFSKHS
ncbi:MAG: nucleoside-diphosphate kinase [Caldisericia bacterium]|nr:nucleoside-diphosphate kinase [Caldisericia bacterium]